MGKLKVFTMVACVLSVLVVAASAHAARKYPSRPITTTVVWGAGGGTDIINRMIMAEMAKNLDVRISVRNKTGGVAGSIGMSYVLGRKADGYNLVGISESNVTAAVNGGWTKKFDVWSPFIVGGSPDVISVVADSPYKTIEDLIAATKTSNIKAAGGGAGSVHHLNLLALVNELGVDMKFVPYPGSAPSQSAAITGEVDVVMTSVAEQASLIKGGKLRPLAVMLPEGFDIQGFGAIPSVVASYPQLEPRLPIPQSIGFAIHQNAPDEVKAVLASAFEKALQSEKVQSWAAENHYKLSGKHGDDARTVFSELESKFSWTLQDLGAAKVHPGSLGITRVK